MKVRELMERLKDVYPTNYKSFDGHEGEYLVVDFNGLFLQDFVTESV